MYDFDQDAFTAWLTARGMKSDGNVLVMYDNKAMKSTSLKSAIRNKRRIYMPINIGVASGTSGRLKNEDITECLNWQIDFEYPQDPDKAIEVGRLFLQKLIQRKWTEEGQDMQHSGAGCRIILGTAPIFTREKGQQQKVSDAWKRIIVGEGSEINRLFQQCCKHVGIEMKIDFCPISQPAAPDGVWRYTNPKKQDAAFLKDGFLRTRIVGDGKRHESKRLRAAILNALEHPIKNDQYWEEEQYELDEEVTFESNIEADIVVKHATNYVAKYNLLYKTGARDRTKAFCTLVNAMAKHHTKEVALKCATLLNDVVESPYDSKQAIKVAQTILSKFNIVTPNSKDKEMIIAPERKTPIVAMTFQEKDALALWSTSRIKQQKGSKVAIRDVYAKYVKWNQSIGGTPVSQRQFTRFLEEKGIIAKTARVEGYTSTQRCFVDIVVIQEMKHQQNETDEQEHYEVIDFTQKFEKKRNTIILSTKTT